MLGSVLMRIRTPWSRRKMIVWAMLRCPANRKMTGNANVFDPGALA